MNRGRTNYSGPGRLWIFLSLSFAGLDGLVMHAQQLETSEVPRVAAKANARVAIRALLEEQAQAWNDGDLEAFMRYYWNSENLTFSAGGNTTRGWKATRDRYRQRYPDHETMGQLSFSDLEIVPLGDTTAYVLGRWNLQPSAGPEVEGNFTLVFRLADGAWRIVHDHTSVETPQE